MFHSETLFIVGAGASCEFGLPSGADIKSKIADLIDIRFDGFAPSSGDWQIIECFKKVARESDTLAGNINPILHKCWLLRDALPAAISIDNLLHAHQGDAYVELAGKLGIVKAVLEAEQSSTLHPGETHPPIINLADIADTWLMWFFKMASEGITKANAKSLFENVTIICFNYDRCIEWFLPQAVQAYYGFDAPVAEEIAGQLRIYHPYGTVGSLKALPFGAKRANILDAAKTILTFSEGLSDQAFIGAIRKQVEEAETLVFLGFAFHPMNMALLTPPEEAFASRIFATSYGLSDEDENVIEDDILAMVRKDRVVSDDLGLIDTSPSYIPKFANLNCGAFFQKFFRSLSAASTLG